MAKLVALPSLDMIDGFRGVVDFYVYHASVDPDAGAVGVACARKWPRSPGRRRAPAVEAQWQDFIWAARHWTELPLYIQDAYNSMASGSGLTGKDLFTRGFLSGLYAYPSSGESEDDLDRRMRRRHRTRRRR